MRLTLRTLLAYLDDRLPPSNAREIGQKIANSPFATDLVERIREVKRRRRLAAPDKSQPLVEPNLIAEYLDDQLTPELVARVEREILSSDVMLAEVAAAHEILGLLRDPVTVEPRLRDRLYGLDPTGKTDVVRAVGGVASAARPSAETVKQWKPLTPRNVPSKRTPVIIAAVLGLAWLAVTLSDSTLFGPKSTDDIASQDGGEPAVNGKPDEQPAQKEPAVENPLAPDENAVVGGAQQDGNPLSAEVSNAAPADNASTALAMNNAAPAESKSPASAALPDASVSKAENGPAGSEPSKEVMANNVEPIADSVPALDVDVAVPADYFLQADSRSVLVLDQNKNRWLTFAQLPGAELIQPAPNTVNCGPIIRESWFGVTERFPLLMTTSSMGYAADLLGPCLVRFQNGANGGLDLLTGRLKLGVDRSLPWDNEHPPVFVLGVGFQTADLVMLNQESRVAIEATPIAAAEGTPPNAIEDEDPAFPMLLDSDLVVSVYVSDGSMALKLPGNEEPITLAKGQRATWVVLGMKDIGSFNVDQVDSLAAMPKWWLGSNVEVAPETTKQNLRLLEALSKPAEPGDSVLPLLDDRNPQVGLLAVQVLALTRDADRLMSILFEIRDETIHRAAIDGLGSIANNSKTAQQAILRSLETRLPKAEAEIILQLIQGLTESQAGDPAVAADLLAMLNSDRLATRTLAIYRMEQITNDRKGFHPDGEASRRRDAVRRWQRYLEQNAGRLIP